MPDTPSSIGDRMKRLRIVSRIEGTTLLVLLFVAVPLKHLAGLPVAVSIVGPLHGLAFLLYIWRVMKTVSTETWRTGEIARMVIVAFIPFGAFLNAPFMRRKEDELKGRAKVASGT